jgi:hypothetical protein
VLVVGSFLLWPEEAAWADAVPPVRLQVKEVAQDSYEVQWSVPKVISPRAMPSPRLPEQCRPDGARTFLDQPSAWLTRQLFRCPDGLPGQTVGIYFPEFNAGMGTVIRVELLTGERYAHMLNPGETSWQIPERPVSGLTRAFETASDAVRGGVIHFFTAWTHLAFLVVLCLLGGLEGRVRLATVFLVAQGAAVFLHSLFGLRIDLPLAEIGLALATVLLAREALRLTDDRRQLSGLVAAAGVVHGLGLPGLAAQQGEAEPGLAFLLLLVLGMDAALLLSAAVLWLLARLLPQRASHTRAASVLTYLAGGLAAAASLGALAAGPAASPQGTDVELPSLVSSFDASAAAGRLVSSVPDVPLQSFVAIEAFEVRLEVLVRPKLVAPRLGLSGESEIPVEAQDEVKLRAEELVVEQVGLRIDGDTVEPDTRQVDFLTFDAQGALPRPTPVAEPFEEAWIGVSAVYFTEAPAEEVTLDWQSFDVTPEVPATVTDPEMTRSVTLSEREPVLSWQNQLSESLVPTVEAISVEPNRVPIPIGSLLLVALALVTLVVAVRGRVEASGTGPSLTPSLAPARVLLAAAILLAPFGQVALALPTSMSRAPSEGQAKRILAGLLGNMYRAFEFREESVVYDRLALSVTGDTLAQIYLDHRRTLEMEERGGARARVEAIEVLEVGDVEPAGDGGFHCDASWTIAGTVTHFGHRHFRQNRYHARATVIAEDGHWRIQSIEVLDEERVR